MLLVRKQGENGWRSPKVTAYSDESSLQTLIQHSPDLLSGADGAPMAMVSEVYVSGIGSADLVGVDCSGGITIVECKLKANPDIRRQVVGQIFAYASGLSGLTYEQFDALFAAKEAPLVQLMTRLGPEDWDEETFRSQVSKNLATGNFRLVIAVDEITEELKGIVRYINQHTTAELQFLALELTYIADDGFEILVPETYGEETIQSKSGSPKGKSWDEVSVFEALTNCCTPSGVQAVRQLYQYALDRGGSFRWGFGIHAAVTARIPVGGKPASVFSIYEWPEGKGSLAFNFEYLLGYVPNDVIANFIERLRTIPNIGSRLNGVEQVGFKKRPSVPVDEVLARPGATDIVMEAIDELLASASETSEGASAGSK